MPNARGIKYKPGISNQAAQNSDNPIPKHTTKYWGINPIIQMEKRGTYGRPNVKWICSNSKAFGLNTLGFGSGGPLKNKMGRKPMNENQPRAYRWITPISPLGFERWKEKAKKKSGGSSPEKEKTNPHKTKKVPIQTPWRHTSNQRSFPIEFAFCDAEPGSFAQHSAMNLPFYIGKGRAQQEQGASHYQMQENRGQRIALEKSLNMRIKKKTTQSRRQYFSPHDRERKKKKAKIQIAHPQGTELFAWPKHGE